MESQTAQNSETDKIAIIAAVIAGAMWIYEQVRLDDRISIAMLLCLSFIILGVLYLMSVGLTMSMNKRAKIRKKLANKVKHYLFNFTIKYFWFILLYLLYLAAMSICNFSFKAANTILTILTIFFGIICIASLFNRPQKIIESFLSKIDKMIKDPEI